MLIIVAWADCLQGGTLEKITARMKGLITRASKHIQAGNIPLKLIVPNLFKKSCKISQWRFPYRAFLIEFLSNLLSFIPTYIFTEQDPASASAKENFASDEINRIPSFDLRFIC